MGQMFSPTCQNGHCWLWSGTRIAGRSLSPSLASSMCRRATARDMPAAPIEREPGQWWYRAGSARVACLSGCWHRRTCGWLPFIRNEARLQESQISAPLVMAARLAWIRQYSRLDALAFYLMISLTIFWACPSSADGLQVAIAHRCICVIGCSIESALAVDRFYIIS